MAISDTAMASATLCTASTNRIIQTGTLNGLSFDFVLFCVSGLFSKSRTVRGSKTKHKHHLEFPTNEVSYYANNHFLDCESQQNCDHLKMGTIFFHEMPCFLHKTPFLLTGLKTTSVTLVFQVI